MELPFYQPIYLRLLLLILYLVYYLGGRQVSTSIYILISEETTTRITKY